MDEFKAGDRVAIRGEGMSSRKALRLGTVARVLKRFIELEDGRKFALNGSPYPHQPYSWVHLLPLTDELEIEHRRQCVVRFLSTRGWDALDLVTLERIVALVKEAAKDPEALADK